QRLIPHLNLRGGQEPRHSAVQVKVWPRIHFALLAGAKLLHDLVFSSHNGGQIDRDIGGPDSPTARMAGVMRYLCAGNHRLRRRAACIDTGTTQFRLLDQGYRSAKVCEPLSKRITTLPRTDDDRVVFHVCEPLMLSIELNNCN